MSTCAPGLNKNNFCHTLYVRTINGRIILYLTGDKFFNFEVSIKSQNVKIQALWEITRVRNWNSKVRTCKNKHCKKIRTRGYTYTLFFCDIEAMANKKKEDRNGPLKLQIKLRWASYFKSHWSSLMINGSQNMKVSGALFDELCLAPSAYIKNVTFSI